MLKVRGGSFRPEFAEQAARVLESSGVVVHPAETIHGLGCRYDSAGAVKRILRIKGREQGKPLIVLVPGLGWAERLCGDIPHAARRLAGLFWPGRLTLVLDASEQARETCPWIGKTVAVRQCGHPFTARVIELADLPMVSTSLNPSGLALNADPGLALEELAALCEGRPGLKVDLAVIDERLISGAAKPSTIVAVGADGAARVIREGACPLAEIAEKSGLKLAE